jgi:hypothetical protein
MPKPFFNIPSIKSLSFDERMRLISTLTKLSSIDSYINTHTAYSSCLNLIRALSTPDSDIRTYSFDDEDDFNSRDAQDFYDDPNGITLDDSLQGNRFLIKLRQLKRAKDLKAVSKDQEWEKAQLTYIFPSEIDLQRLQTIILTDEQRNLQH